MAEPSHLAIQNTILQLGDRVDRGFEQINERLHALDDRVVSQSDRIGRLEVEGATRGAAIENVSKDVTAVAAKVDALHQQMAATAPAPWWARLIPTRDMILAVVAGVGLGVLVVIVLIEVNLVDLVATLTP